VVSAQHRHTEHCCPALFPRSSYLSPGSTSTHLRLHTPFQPQSHHLQAPPHLLPAITLSPSPEEHGWRSRRSILTNYKPSPGMRSYTEPLSLLSAVTEVQSSLCNPTGKSFLSPVGEHRAGLHQPQICGFHSCGAMTILLPCFFSAHPPWLHFFSHS
jgi:hypothetical protein